MEVLLSIKPEFVEQIALGSKLYEYRKRIFKKQVDKVVIYASKPVGKIVGEFTIEDIIHEEPDVLWKLTKEYSGISKEFFNEYFENREEAFAIKIKNFYEYEEPIDPRIKFDNFTAPQSYMYIDKAVLV